MFAIREIYGERRWLSKHTEDVENILHCHMASWTTNENDAIWFDTEPKIMRVLGKTWYEVIKKPLWTEDQVNALNQYQKAGQFHPFTCNNRNDGNHPDEPKYGDHSVLRAGPNGWYCEYCDYTQNWAHDFMFSPPSF